MMKLKVVSARREVEQSHHRALFMRDCKWTEADLRRLDDLLENGDYTEDKLRALRDQSLSAPPRPHGEVLRQIESMPTGVPVDTTEARPPWLSSVANNRDVFDDSVTFEVSTAGSIAKTYWKLMFATQDTIRVHVAPLNLVEVYAPVPGSAPLPIDRWRWTWRVDYMEHQPWTALPTKDVNMISVIQHVNGQHWARPIVLIFGAPKGRRGITPGGGGAR